MKITAPGSVFISGEYLILDGEPALVSAVNRYASAEFSTQDGYSVDGLEGLPDMALPLAVCHVLGVCPDKLTHVKTSITGFGNNGKKYGLSSSAASCVALVRLLAPNLNAKEVLSASGSAHRRFQKGKGSNADVQLAVCGGTSVVFSQNLSKEATFDLVDFPEDLRCEVVWMESSAKTVSFISKFESAKTDPCFANTYKQMKENNRSILAAFKKRQVGDFLKMLAVQDDLLDQLGTIIGAPIHVNAHRDLKKVCGDDFVAKVSGSGGGDISLVFGRAEADWSSLHSRLPDSVQLLKTSLHAQINE